jgi:AraC-like DNA-binding protein
VREVGRWQLASSGDDDITHMLPAPVQSLASVETWALEHIHERITVEELARVAGASVSTLRRAFVRTVGISPYEWLLRQRIRVAQEMLRTGTQPVRAVADAVGVPDPAYFARLFSSRVGCTPREYRRAHMRL